MTGEYTVRIIKLESENIKRLQAVEINPQGDMVTLGGKNAQGKSSVLDSIVYALGGKRAVCDRPVRDGQDKARVVCQLEDIVVTRTFTKSGGGNLIVSNRDGSRFNSPQKILDRLTGKLTFDPLEFCRMDPKKQLETLKGLVGLDFSEQDRKRQALYEQRTQVNRDIKRARAGLDSRPVHKDVPELEVSVSELMEELKQQQEKNRENQNRRNDLQKLESRIARGQEYVSDLKRQIEDLQARLLQAREQLSRLEQERESLSEQVSNLVDVDEQALLDRIANTESVNRKVRENKDRGRAEQELKDLEVKSEQLSRDIQAIDQDKNKALQEAKFPVEGLSFDESGIFFNGLPFSQASQAEQLRVSVAMGFAMNPKLKVLLVRDGSLLDDDSLKTLAGLAREYDGQVWIERVGEGEECSVIIEDGQVKEDIPAPEHKLEDSAERKTEEEVL